MFKSVALGLMGLQCVAGLRFAMYVDEYVSPPLSPSETYRH